MADKLKTGIPVVPSFVEGEAPPAGKLNALGAQTQNGMTELEKAVGDIHDESHPYSGSSGTRLTQEWGKDITDGTALSGAIERRLDIANLARLIGPASNLNPTILDIAGSIVDEVPALRGDYVFDLRYPPSNTPVFTNNGAALTNPVVSAAHLAATGDWAIDGRTIYSATAIPNATRVSYTTDSLAWGQGSSYAHGRFNVIPDPNQAGSASTEQLGITGPDANGRYTIALPAVRVQQRNATDDDTALDAAVDNSYDVQLQLPYVLTENLSAGDAIPEGFLYLRNDTTGELYENASYFYESDTAIKVSGIDLSGAAAYEYYLITVGSDITTAIDDMRNKLFKHKHDGTFGDPAISVFDLRDIIAYAGASGPWSGSEIPGNFAPQYLHRDGTTSEDASNLNDRNSMRGWLGFVYQGMDAGQGYSPAFPVLAETYGVQFGDPGNAAQRGRIYKGQNHILKYEAPTSGSHNFTEGEVRTEEGVVLNEDAAQTAFKVWTGEENVTLISTNDLKDFLVTGLNGKEIYSVSVVVDIDPLVLSGAPIWVGPGGFNYLGLDCSFACAVDSAGANVAIYFGGAGWNNLDHTVRYVIHYKD